jgi:uncharacterized protein DUF3300
MRSTLPDKRVPPVPANRRHQGGDIFGQILRDILGGGAGDQVQVPRQGVGAAVFGDRLEAGRNVEQSQLGLRDFTRSNQLRDAAIAGGLNLRVSADAKGVQHMQRVRDLISRSIQQPKGRSRLRRESYAETARITPMRIVTILMALVFALSMPRLSLAEGAPGAEGAADAQQLLDAGQLDQLVAPIALYPDALVAQALMASTYPLEIVQADRWAKTNRALKGDKLDDALTKQDWDASVKALVATPTVLAMMNDDLDWTEKLGDAVLAQQADVMDAIQRLRSKAQANGKLATTKQQTVTVTQEADKPVIVIAPASPETVYVPYYDPAVVYGAWPYPAYPPYYFPPAPGYVVGGALASGIAWGAGFAIGNAIWDGCDWGHGNIHVDIDKNVNINKHVNRNNECRELATQLLSPARRR